jgi:tRNA pseudouridine38-40 synthase
MNKACSVLPGKRDFASFTNKKGGAKNTVRTIFEAGLDQDGEFVIFDVSANAFLPQQVRRIAGCLIKIGLGDMEIEELHRMLVSPEIGAAKPPAPPHGLCLMKVNYSEIGFGNQQ